MYVIPTKQEYKKGKKATLYGNLERRFYAYKIKAPPQMLDMWDANNKRTKPLMASDYFDYYILNTMVGIGSKNDQEIIQRVHIRFAIWPIKEGYIAPEIVLIYPSYVSKTVGEVFINKNTESQSGYGLGGKATGSFTVPNLQLGLNSFINFLRKSSASKKITSTLPNEILITNASGCGNHAIWEFYKGEGIRDVGQYNLEIIFRLPNSLNFDKCVEFPYYIDWNIEINGRTLIDHDDDLNDPSNESVPGTHGRKVMFNEGFKEGNNKEKNKSTQNNKKKSYKERYGDDHSLKVLRPLRLIANQKDENVVSFLQDQSISYSSQPSINIISNDEKEFKVVGELPGIDKENIDIDIYENMLKINAQSSPERKYFRVFDLPKDIDIDTAKSTFKNGLLEITFAKKLQAKFTGKKIMIEQR